MAQSQEVFFKPERYVEIPTKDLLSWMFDDVPFDEEKPIYLDAFNTNRTISSRQARVLIRKLVAGFRAAGLKEGDCVCLHAFNDIFYPIIFLGVVAAGGVWTGTNPAYTRHELAHHFKTSRTTFILTEPEDYMFRPILEAAADCGIKKDKIMIFDVLGQPLPAGYRSWKSLLNHGEQDWVRFDGLEKCRTTTAARLFSSGTTGLPKAAIVSHYNLIAQHTLIHEQAEAEDHYEVKRLLCLPFFHASSVPVGHTTPLRAGHTTYVMRRFDLDSYFKYLEKYEIPEIGIVPPIVVAAINSPLNKRYSLKKSITAVCGSAPLDKESQKRFLSLMGPDARCTQVWGMTETTCITTIFPWPEKDNTGSVGRFVPNMEAKLVDDNGNDISAYDVQGEICVRGPLVISGYFENPKANEEAFENGWFHTGDIGFCISGSKKWYIVDRKKELIKVRGFQVAPLELEGVLLSHPQIVDAAVIGVYPRGLDGGEVPRAYVVRRPGLEGGKLTQDEVKRYVRARLASYKALDGGVIFMDSIPKNASGKVLKKSLRDEAKLEFASKI